MSRTGPHPRHATFLRLLRISLIVGALYDILFAVLMVVAPRLPEHLLGLPQPGERYYLWLIAILLTMLAACYLLAAYDPVSYRGNIVIAIFGRALGGVALLFATLNGRPELIGLVPLGVADLTFAALHAVFWWPIRS